MRSLQLKTRLAKLGIDRRMVRIYVASFIAYLSNAYNVLMLYPFLPFMTKFFLPEKDTASINSYSGIVVASYFGGRIFGSYIWGSLADTVGRKPVLLANCLLMSGTLLITAFSVNYGMIVALRCFLGLCNGVIVVSRAVISESSTNANQAFGFSVLAFSWMTAAVLAPLFSGLSANPIGQYNLTLSNGTLNFFLTTFPYALPFILNMIVCIAGALAVIFILPETLLKVPRELDLRAQDTSMQEMTLDHSDEALLQPDTAQQNVDVATDLKHVAAAKSNEGKLQWSQWRAGCCKGRCRHTLLVNGTKLKHWGKNMKSILRNKAFLIAMSAQCLLAVIESSSDSVYALWFATPVSLVVKHRWPRLLPEGYWSVQHCDSGNIFTIQPTCIPLDGKSIWFHSDCSDDCHCNGCLICAIPNHTLFSIEGISHCSMVCGYLLSYTDDLNLQHMLRCPEFVYWQFRHS